MTQPQPSLEEWARRMAAKAGTRPPPPSLPGSDLSVLKAIGDDVRGRLDAQPAAKAVPGIGLDMYAVRNFLSPDECAELIALVDADVRPSTVLSASGDTSMRTSETCDLPGTHPLVATVDARIADLLGLSLENSETLQGQRYHVGQQFKVHNDYFGANQTYSSVVAEEGGQRTWTAMVFLNKPDAGGHTRFPRANVMVTPTAGALLTWNNVDREGHPNRQSHHEGCAVEQGSKYVLTKWFRERPWAGSAKSDALRY